MEGGGWRVVCLWVWVRCIAARGQRYIRAAASHGRIDGNSNSAHRLSSVSQFLPIFSIFRSFIPRFVSAIICSNHKHVGYICLHSLAIAQLCFASVCLALFWGPQWDLSCRLHLLKLNASLYILIFSSAATPTSISIKWIFMWYVSPLPVSLFSLFKSYFFMMLDRILDIYIHIIIWM